MCSLIGLCFRSLVALFLFLSFLIIFLEMFFITFYSHLHVFCSARRVSYYCSCSAFFLFSFLFTVLKHYIISFFLFLFPFLLLFSFLKYIIIFPVFASFLSFLLIKPQLFWDLSGKTTGYNEVGLPVRIPHHRRKSL